MVICGKETKSCWNGMLAVKRKRKNEQHGWCR